MGWGGRGAWSWPGGFEDEWCLQSFRMAAREVRVLAQWACCRGAGYGPWSAGDGGGVAHGVRAHWALRVRSSGPAPAGRRYGPWRARKPPGSWSQPRTCAQTVCARISARDRVGDASTHALWQLVEDGGRICATNAWHSTLGGIQPLRLGWIIQPEVDGLHGEQGVWPNESGTWGPAQCRQPSAWPNPLGSFGRWAYPK